MIYTLADGEFYKVLNKDDNSFITFGQLVQDQQLSTIHIVIWITEEEYNNLLESEES